MYIPLQTNFYRRHYPKWRFFLPIVDIYFKFTAQVIVYSFVRSIFGIDFSKKLRKKLYTIKNKR
jgi:hypothetical protein